MNNNRFEEEEFTGQRYWGIWKNLFFRARSQWKLLIALGTVAILLASLDVMLPLVTKWIIDSVTGGDATQWRGHVVLYFVLVGGHAICVAVFICLAGKISTHFSYDIRQAGFRRLQELSFSFYDRRSVGWLVTRLTSDCDRLSRILAWGTLDMVWGTFFLINATLFMIILNWKLALVVLTVIPPLVWVSVFFQKRILHTSRSVRKSNSNLTAAFNEAISGVRTTKTLVREDENLHEFKDLTGQMFADSVRNAILSSMYIPAVLALGSLGAGLALWAGGVQVQSGAIEIGMLVAFILYAQQIFQPIQELARLMSELQAAQAAAERVVGLLETDPEIQDSPKLQDQIEQRRNSAPTDGLAEDGFPNQIERVEFRNVCFHYNEGQTVLEDFNLAVHSGQTIALVGPTGGGKTTVVSLLCRFYEPTSGQILINGVDYRQRGLHWLQSNLGSVLQIPQLFSGTIRENIRFGRLEASDEEIIAAARLGNAHEFIMDCEDEYDTQVGQGGGLLSGGQKQLISLTRAILADPQIFVADEATSSVDTETEQAIQKGLEEILKGRISFVIAHRLSTIRSADHILVIQEGRIVEQGNHHELIKRGGEYYQLYTQQFTREETDRLLQGT